MNWRIVAIPITLIPIFIIAIQFDIQIEDILAIGLLPFIGAIIAMVGMGIVLFYLNETFKELELLEGKPMLIVLFSFIFIMGIFISWVSTYFATQRFLNLRSDELYY